MSRSPVSSSPVEIDATATDWLLGLYNDRSAREKNAETFLDLLMSPELRMDCIEFSL